MEKKKKNYKQRKTEVKIIFLRSIKSPQSPAEGKRQGKQCYKNNNKDIILFEFFFFLFLIRVFRCCEHSDMILPYTSVTGVYCILRVIPEEITFFFFLTLEVQFKIFISLYSVFTV